MSSSIDPRATRSRDAILAAARSLLLDEGPAALTHQRVAQQAGVGRATVYRHWPRPEQLLLDLMTDVDMPYFQEPEAPVRSWLHSQLRELADAMAVPHIAAVTLTLMQGALWDPQVATQRDACLEILNERLEVALALAAANREIDISADPIDFSAILVGPIIYRVAIQAGSVSPHFIDHLIDGLGRWDVDSIRRADQNGQPA
ncbi:TetR/AcrR family transcriptional regulator [Planotetraspora phitsanulokensis]|uniref:TetR family transcriptional regulator n=1 Tax=Planotetraspora phitsanulokensis TaxID=575192 RepID=A0A8J3UDK1_9ACTN|nr:TetR/AcrR family transcriptional regulator [Planotetraspora phitsanulokensis]GII42820.1 TetR family transcriptional regulator [Planotetraspora phitsanulokensis]